MRYAHIIGDIVENVIEAEPEVIPTLEGLYIRSDSAQIGDLWTGTEFVPQPPPQPNCGSVISKLAYFQRYPSDKWFALKEAKDPTAAYAKEVFDLASVIDLADPRTQQLLGLLTISTPATQEQFGKTYLLTKEEADKILNTPVSAAEVPAFPLAK